MPKIKFRSLFIPVFAALLITLGWFNVNGQCGADGKQPCRSVTKATAKNTVSKATAKKTVSKQITRKAKEGKICGNPILKCKTGFVNFEPYELPFEVNQIVEESEYFYAVILRSKPSSDESCSEYVSEAYRLTFQRLFPNNKVFVYKCGEESYGAGIPYYRGVTDNVGFMAVYAGKTIQEANVILKKAKDTGLFSGINIRKLKIEFNGT